MNQSIKSKINIPFCLPSIGKEEEQAVINVMRSKWITTGEVTANFEKLFAEKINVKYAIAVNSATAGLHLALDSLKLKKGNYVITTPYTFTSTSEVIRYVNLHPLFVDITKEDYNINPALIKKAAAENKGKISAILPVHIAGHLCKIAEILDNANKYNIPVVEDAAHAFPVAHNGKYAGTFGRLGVFSFYATKTITTGEGGMVVTDDEDIAAHAKIMRLHGIDRDVWDRYKKIKNNWYYEVKFPGFKYNLTDIASAIGIEQLKKAEDFTKQRKKIAAQYTNAFKECDFITLPPYSENHCWHLYIIRINSKKLKVTRDDFIQKLNEKGIGVSVHFIPLHLMPYYKKKYRLKPQDFPNATEKYLSSISLPLYPGLDSEKIEYIIRNVIEIGKNNYV